MHGGGKSMMKPKPMAKRTLDGILESGEVAARVMRSRL